MEVRFLRRHKYGDCSSVGRVEDCGSFGHGFDPHHSPHMKKKDFEKDYVKTIKKVMREEVGLIPTRISKNKKKYSRKNYKIEFED